MTHEPLQVSLITRLRAFGWSLNLTRFNLIALIVTVVLMTIGQGQDLVRSLADTAPVIAYPVFLGGMLLWATSIWLWARVMLDIRFDCVPVPETYMACWRRHLPRLLGALACVSVCINIYRAKGLSTLLLVCSVTALAFYMFMVKRRVLSRWAARKMFDDPERSMLWAEDSYDEPAYDTLLESLAQKRGRLALLTLCGGLVMLVWGLGWPLSLGLTFNTLLLLMLWAATMVPYGSLITYVGNRKGIPIVSLLFAMMIVFSFFNDNHGIRQLVDADVDERLTVQQALAQWDGPQRCDGDACEPLLFIATAGGGIRAAYWTGTVLGYLHDCMRSPDDCMAGAATTAMPGLGQRLFAISGVSGGSVGSAVYRALLEDVGRDAPLSGHIRGILGNSFLGPASAGLLYPDLLQRFLPFEAMTSRATLFEQGLEYYYREHLVDAGLLAADAVEGGLEQSFTSLHAAWPALFLNSTWTQTGRRVVAATLAAGEQVLYKDLLDSMQRDLRLSTAAHNSARFPYISPAGSWQPRDVEGAPRQRLQDGGLYENYGAETLMEILDIADGALGERFRPVVLVISSDPGLPGEPGAFEYRPVTDFLNEILTTVWTFVNARSGRGIDAMERLSGWRPQHRDASDGAHYFYVRMCERDTRSDPPLGWTLSDKARSEIEGYLDDSSSCGAENLGKLAELMRLLAGRIR